MVSGWISHRVQKDADFREDLMAPVETSGLVQRSVAFSPHAAFSPTAMLLLIILFNPLRVTNELQ
jgi:hypothetical protein